MSTTHNRFNDQPPHLQPSPPSHVNSRFDQRYPIPSHATRGNRGDIINNTNAAAVDDDTNDANDGSHVKLRKKMISDDTVIEELSTALGFPDVYYEQHRNGREWILDSGTAEYGYSDDSVRRLRLSAYGSFITSSDEERINAFNSILQMNEESLRESWKSISTIKTREVSPISIYPSIHWRVHACTISHKKNIFLCSHPPRTHTHSLTHFHVVNLRNGAPCSATRSRQHGVQFPGSHSRGSSMR